MKKIVLVAMDAGPSDALTIVARKLTEQGHEVSTFFGNGQPFPEDVTDHIRDAIAESDNILIGLSSTEMRGYEELFAAKTALVQNKPFGFFCTTFGEFRRTWFQDVLKQADFLFVINEAEKHAAAEYAPAAIIVDSGNPQWADFFKPPMSRDEVRDHLGIASSQRMIMVGGSKELDRNISLFGKVVEACNKFGAPLHIVVGRHPGDRNNPQVYGETMATSYHPVKFLDQNMRSNTAIAGADLVISSISAIGVTGACLRIPVIDVVTKLDKDWWETLSGFPTWEPIEQGASVAVATAEELANSIEALLLDRESPSIPAMRTAQEKAFSLEAVQGAADAIIDTLLHICAKQTG